MSEAQSGEIIIYQSEEGKTKIEVRLEDDNVWLTQKMMAELFQTTPQNITLHHSGNCVFKHACGCSESFCFCQCHVSCFFLW
jgi:hypothetical protein